MIPIKNVHPLSPEAIFDILKKEFADKINNKLHSNLSIDYAHVYDVINISFPEIADDTVFTITVTNDEVTLSNNGHSTEHNTELLETNLVDFLIEKCS